MPTVPPGSRIVFYEGVGGQQCEVSWPSNSTGQARLLTVLTTHTLARSERLNRAWGPPEHTIPLDFPKAARDRNTQILVSTCLSLAWWSFGEGPPSQGQV